MFKLGSRVASSPMERGPNGGGANVLTENPFKEQDENKIGRRQQHQQRKQQSWGSNKSNKENRGERRRRQRNVRIKWNQVAMMTEETTTVSPPSPPPQIKPHYQPARPHDAPMTKSDLYFALDCEMVGVGEEGLDSALARVCIVNWENKVVLDTFVKVPVPVTDYRTYVSGVRPEDIESDDAMTFEDCRKAVSKILNGKILIGHGLENDLRCLHLSHPLSDVRDTATYSSLMKEIDDPIMGKVLRPRKLRELVWEKLGRHIQIGGIAHSPEEDAIAALDLYKSTRREWEEHLIMKSMEKNREMENQRLRLNTQLFHQRSQSPPHSPYAADRLVIGPPSPTNMHQQQRTFDMSNNIGMVHSQGYRGLSYPNQPPPPQFVAPSQAQSSYNSFRFPTLVPSHLLNNRSRRRNSKERLARHFQEMQFKEGEQQVQNIDIGKQ